ncbi:MAG: Ig-like domain-containing protein, partial [Gemmatimonadetes bacterium]|nr:Ig-like domain-containing protein [Gemmatimonadota bacterium]
MRYRSLAAIAGVAALLAACSSGDSTGAGGNSVASVSVQPDPLTLSVGDTTRLTAQALSSTGQALSTTITYQSANPAIATVSAAGTVTGVAVGTTQIVATAGGRSATVTVNVVAQTGLRSINVNTDQGCSNPNFVQFRTVATSQHAILMEDTRNPPGGFTTAEYQAIADRFDSQVWPTDTNAFGTPSDIDQNGKVIVLFTRAVN